MQCNLFGYHAFPPLGVHFREEKKNLPVPLTVVKTQNARRKVFTELRKARRVILEMCILPGNKLCHLDRVKSMDRASDIQHRYEQSARSVRWNKLRQDELNAV